MQLHNQHNSHSHSGSSVANSGDGSSASQESLISDFGDGSPVYGVALQDYFVNGSANVAPVYGATMQEYLISASGVASAVSAASTHSATTSSNITSAAWSLPASTMVGSPNGLQFDLTWDSSVANAPHGFVQAVVDAAKVYTELFSNKEVINIDIGYGEVGGLQLPANALGATEYNAYLTNYPTVTTALANTGFTFAAANEPTSSSQFLITSAEAKTLGLVDPTAGLDANIGFSTLSGTGYSYNTTANAYGLNGGTGPNQFDLQAVAEHEISEAMGRIGWEGDLIINDQHTYTPLDLFNYRSPGVLELSANGGYFSVNDGRTNLGNYNNAGVNGGDIADWASSNSVAQSNTLGLPRGSYDAYDAFTFPGYNGNISASDIIEDAALGYTLKSSPTANVALLGNYMAASFAGPASLHGETLVAPDVQAPIQQPLLSHPHS